MHWTKRRWHLTSALIVMGGLTSCGGGESARDPDAGVSISAPQHAPANDTATPAPSEMAVPAGGSPSDLRFAP